MKMTKGYKKSESYIVLPSGVEIANGKYNRFKYRKEVFADNEIREYEKRMGSQAATALDCKSGGKPSRVRVPPHSPKTKGKRK
jgi:hypothetical protein